MMDVGQHDQKRMRLTNLKVPQWQGSTERHLPPPPPSSSTSQQPQPTTPSYSSLSTPFNSRLDNHITLLDRDRRPPDHVPTFESQEIRRPNSGSHAYHPLPPGPHPFTTPRDPVIKRDASDELQYRSSPGGMISESINPTSPNHESPNKLSQASPNYDTSRSLQPYIHGNYSVTNGSLTEPYNHPYTTTSFHHPLQQSPSQAPTQSPPQPQPQPPPPPPPTTHQSQPSRNSDQFGTKFPYSGTRILDQQVRKKPQRAAQACDCCRTAKAKCDEGRPSCSSCKENGKECRYRDPPPKQQDKTSADILESLNRLESVMQKFTRQMDNLTNEVNEIKKTQQHQNPRLPTNIQSSYRLKDEKDEDHSGILRYTYDESSITSSEQLTRPSNGSIITMTPNQRLRLDSNLPSNNEENLNNTTDIDINDSNDVDDDNDDVDDDDDDDGAVVESGPPKPPSIPINHTTGAGRLLLVPPIKKMCADIKLPSKFKSEKYPYTLEWKRGLLRLYGRGEGNEVTPGYEPTSDHIETTPFDGQFDTSPPFNGDEWGQIGGITLSSHPFEYPRNRINAESMPDFSRETVLELVDSYKNNINNLHPILTPKQLNHLVESFLRSVHDTRSRPKPTQTSSTSSSTTSLTSSTSNTPSLAGPRKNPESPGNKRKRSPTMTDYPDTHTYSEYKNGYPFRSISSAIVLLCMALGKICQVKGKIPQMPSDNEICPSVSNNSFGASPMTRNGDSPLSSSMFPNFSSRAASYGANNVSDSDRLTSRSRRQSLEGPPREHFDRIISKLRNIDVIPGLIYFALATDILGNQMAGSSLQHVHANILAGLYHAQLARIMESAAYISTACRALQVIIRPRLERFKKATVEQKIVDAKDNPVIFAFWTCLQLESDIVAEIPCPQTGILTFEEDMPGPNLQAAHHDDGFDKSVIESYSAQLFLRKHLNSLHCMFYKPRDPNSEDKFTELVLANNRGAEPKFPSIELLSQSLNGIDVYAPTMHWMIYSPKPPDDILGARLRAKYYGAMVITYRPFVLQVLERSEPLSPEAPDSVVEQISEEYLSEVKAPIVRHDIKETKDIDPKALEYVRIGLRSLIESTTAFYGLGHPGEKRITVTNVWGTAHAQWGNVLTLQASYMNPILKPLLLELITKEDLIMLVEKTMGFLALVGSPSSALSIDWKILDLTSRKNGLRSLSTISLSKFPTTSLRDLVKV